ncbi:uncharacterized protein LOC116197026 isoform X2 [Punica granatum]|uniref:Uncharacterized protein LOC116197026 isoform X2 n=1 Tax=Punica granatum TaxID=22663 RepID=A0A6P8CNF2_PUNGR|nr:uncharacterized protein LOC116197026 isoform X2 [Punica granatum]
MRVGHLGFWIMEQGHSSSTVTGVCFAFLPSERPILKQGVWILPRSTFPPVDYVQVIKASEYKGTISNREIIILCLLYYSSNVEKSFG